MGLGGREAMTIEQYRSMNLSRPVTQDPIYNHAAGNPEGRPSVDETRGKLNQTTALIYEVTIDKIIGDVAVNHGVLDLTQVQAIPEGPTDIQIAS